MTVAGADPSVGERVAEAEGLLEGLAMPGTPAAAALAATRSDPPVRAPVLLNALDALADQARLSMRAGEHATNGHEASHWLVSTAYEWQLYLRWLVAEQRQLGPHVAALDEHERVDAQRAFETVGRECEAARRVWGALAMQRRRRAVGRRPATRPDDLDELAAVTVEGQLYVSVDELTGSLRERAEAFSGAAAESADVDDHLGELVSETVSSETELPRRRPGRGRYRAGQRQ